MIVRPVVCVNPCPVFGGTFPVAMKASKLRSNVKLEETMEVISPEGKFISESICRALPSYVKIVFNGLLGLNESVVCCLAFRNTVY
jgi:hypothetical protein